MALHSVEGNTQAFDLMKQRIGNGTVGGTQLTPGSVKANRLSGIIDNSDPRILYGVAAGGAGTFVLYSSMAFAREGSVVLTQTAGAAIQFQFTGTSIGVIGPANSGGDPSVTVTIDGEVAYGRVPVSSSLAIGYLTSASQPAIDDDTEYIYLPDSSSFPSSGYVLIDDEVIQYSANVGNTLTIQTRGAFDTVQTDHKWSSTVYLWTNSMSCYNPGGFSNQILLFYRPFLSDGPHTITIQASGTGWLVFDAFTTGQLIGAGLMSMQTGTINLSSTTSGNGHCTFGTLQSYNNDVQISGFVGYTQTTPNTYADNATIMGQLGVTNDTTVPGLEWLPIYYMHNGPTSASVALRLTFNYLGESLS